jgi:hypothetical protein
MWGNPLPAACTVTGLSCSFVIDSGFENNVERLAERFDRAPRAVEHINAIVIAAGYFQTPVTLFISDSP